MIFLKISFCFLALTVFGCSSSNPRYVSTESRPVNKVQTIQPPKSINSTISFGRILQLYLGKPYAGHSRHDPGMDCSLFTGEVFKKFAKIDLPRKSEDQFKVGDQVKNDQFAFGDLVFFNINGKGVSHVGIYVGYDEFIHASTSNGVIISGLQEKYWSERFMGARRVIK